MTSREAELQATIDRLARELAETRRELAESEARARTWRRVAQWIHRALSPETLPPEE
jgi:hypothetical protein